MRRFQSTADVFRFILSVFFSSSPTSHKTKTPSNKTNIKLKSMVIRDRATKRILHSKTLTNNNSCHRSTSLLDESINFDEKKWAKKRRKFKKETLIHTEATTTAAATTIGSSSTIWMLSTSHPFFSTSLIRMVGPLYFHIIRSTFRIKNMYFSSMQIMAFESSRAEPNRAEIHFAFFSRFFFYWTNSMKISDNAGKFLQ